MSAPMAATLVRQEDGSTLALDAVVTVQFTFSVEVTDHPIEDGSVVSDHAIKQPVLITVDGVVTETPIDADADTSGIQRVQAALDWLDASVGKLIDVVTDRLGTYTDCLLTGWPTSIDGVRRLRIPIALKQVRIATAGSVTITVEATAGGDAENAADEVDVGEQGTTDTAEEPAQEEDDRSTLATLIDAMG